MTNVPLKPQAYEYQLLTDCVNVLKSLDPMAQSKIVQVLSGMCVLAQMEQTESSVTPS